MVSIPRVLGQSALSYASLPMQVKQYSALSINLVPFCSKNSTVSCSWPKVARLSTLDQSAKTHKLSWSTLSHTVPGSAVMRRIQPSSCWRLSMPARVAKVKTGTLSGKAVKRPRPPSMRLTSYTHLEPTSSQKRKREHMPSSPCHLVLRLLSSRTEFSNNTGECPPTSLPNGLSESPRDFSSVSVSSSRHRVNRDYRTSSLAPLWCAPSSHLWSNRQVQPLFISPALPTLF